MALLYEQIYSAIIGDVRSGKLRPGDAVPSELELSKSFGVSRITSRKALDLLRQQGVVVRQRGRGTFVADDADRAASGLPTSAPKRIGFVVPDMSDTFGVRILNGIEEEVNRRGYQLVLRRTRGNVEQESRAIAEFVATGVSGMIVFPVHGEYYNAELVRNALAGFPVVLVDRVLPGIPVTSVCTDNIAAASALTRLLCDAGHQQIAFVSPPPHHTSSIEQRLRGFRGALAGHVRGLELTSLQSTLPGKSVIDDHAADRERVLGFFDAHPEITGVVSCEYTLALLVELVLNDAGRPVPEIVCFDAAYEPFNRYPFTYVRQNELRIGQVAVDTLIDQIEHGSAPQQLLVEFDIIPGSS